MPVYTEGGPQPEVSREARITRAHYPDFVEERLDAIAQEWGNETEQAALPSAKRKGYKWNDTPEGMLRMRLSDIVLTDPDFSEEASEDHVQVVAAFDLLAFPRLSAREKLTAIQQLKWPRQLLKEQGSDPSGITLTPSQAETLARVARRVDLPYDPAQTFFPFGPIDEQTPKRITEIEDPDVTKLLDHAPQDRDEKITYLLENISGLHATQRTKLLIELPKDEFDEFVQRRQERYRALAEDMAAPEDQASLTDKSKFVRNRALLTYTRPAWEVDAAILRHHLDNENDDYPLYLDPLVQEDLQLQEDLARFAANQQRPDTKIPEPPDDTRDGSHPDEAEKHA